MVNVHISKVFYDDQYHLKLWNVIALVFNVPPTAFLPNTEVNRYEINTHTHTQREVEKRDGGLVGDSPSLSDLENCNLVVWLNIVLLGSSLRLDDILS